MRVASFKVSTVTSPLATGTWRALSHSRATAERRKGATCGPRILPRQYPSREIRLRQRLITAAAGSPDSLHRTKWMAELEAGRDLSGIAVEGMGFVARYMDEGGGK
jgi:hypothetical protein